MTDLSLLAFAGPCATGPSIQIGDTNIYQKSNIAKFIDGRIINNLAASEGTCHCVSRRTLQVVSIIAGYGGRLPYLALSLNVAGSNKAYGVILAYGSCASFGSLAAWSFLRIVDTQMKPLTRQEKILTESRMSPCIKKTLFASAIVLGFGAQVPFACLAYKFNKPSAFNPHGIVMPSMIFAIDSWVSVYSGYMGLRSLRERKSLKGFENHLSNARSNMYALIEDNRQLLTMVGKSGRVDFVETYDRIKGIDNAPDRTRQLFNLFSRRISNHDLEPTSCAKRIDTAVRAYGYLCAACNIGTLGYVAWLGMDTVAQNVEANITVTAIYVGTALYLNATAIPETAVKLYNLFKNVFTWSYKPTLSDQLAPKLSFALKSLGLVTASLSYGPPVAVCKEYYKSNAGLEGLMEVMLSCANTFLVSMILLSIIDRVLEFQIEKLGNEDSRNIMRVHEKMRLLSSTLTTSPLIEIARYLKILPRETVEKLLGDIDDSVSRLDAYIARIDGRLRLEDQV